jgi:hypothetical protein
MLVETLHGLLLGGPSAYRFGVRLWRRAFGGSPVAPNAGQGAPALSSGNAPPPPALASAAHATSAGPPNPGQPSAGSAAPPSAAQVYTVPPGPAGWTYGQARPEIGGAPDGSVLAFKHIQDAWAPADLAALFDVAAQLGIPVDSLAVVMEHESGCDPSALNKLPAAGLIQLTTGAQLAGFTTADAIRQVGMMSVQEQLRGPVLAYYTRGSSKLRGADPGQLLLYNFVSAFFGKPDSTVISRKGQAIYDGNWQGFDPQERGYFTVGDVYAAARAVVQRAQGNRITKQGAVIGAAQIRVSGAAPAAAASTAAGSSSTAAGPKPVAGAPAKPAPSNAATASKPSPANKPAGRTPATPSSSAPSPADAGDSGAAAWAATSPAGDSGADNSVAPTPDAGDSSSSSLGGMVSPPEPLEAVKTSPDDGSTPSADDGPGADGDASGGDATSGDTASGDTPEAGNTELSSGGGDFFNFGSLVQAVEHAVDSLGGSSAAQPAAQGVANARSAALPPGSPTPQGAGRATSPRTRASASKAPPPAAPSASPSTSTSAWSTSPGTPATPGLDPVLMASPPPDASDGSDDPGAVSDGSQDLASVSAGSQSTGGSDDSARGIMFQAIQGSADDPVLWTWVTVDAWDLDIQVPADAYKCTVGDTPHVRAPVTYAELVQVCALRGMVPPTRDMVDAIYQAAAIHTRPIGLVNAATPAALAQQSLHMADVSFVLQHHANVEADISNAQSGDATSLVEPVGKWFVVDSNGFLRSKYGDCAAVIFGWYDATGTPVQPLSAIHDCNHTDYSQVCRAIGRYARRHSVWVNEQREEQVDLLASYAQKWPQIQRWLTALGG